MSALHVPSIGLVVAGDVAYDGVHQYILEGGHCSMREWLRAIGLYPDRLNPGVVWHWALGLLGG